MLKLKSTHRISFEVLRAIEKTHPIEAAIWWKWIYRGEAEHDGPLYAEPEIEFPFPYLQTGDNDAIKIIGRDVLNSLEKTHPIEATIWQKWTWQGRAAVLP